MGTMGIDGDEEATHTFTCPECGESMRVNTPMRDALVDRGCVICGYSVTAEAFTETPSTDPS